MPPILVWMQRWNFAVMRHHSFRKRGQVQLEVGSVILRTSVYFDNSQVQVVLGTPQLLLVVNLPVGSLPHEYIRYIIPLLYTIHTCQSISRISCREENLVAVVATAVDRQG